MSALTPDEKQALIKAGVDLDNESNFRKFLNKIKSLGLRMLLTYYDKQRSNMFVDNILSYADSVVKVEDWRYSWPTDPDQNNPAAKDYTFRAVVTVPARVFDAIPKSKYSIQMIGTTKTKVSATKKRGTGAASKAAPTTGGKVKPTKNTETDSVQTELDPIKKIVISAYAFLSQYVVFLGARILDPNGETFQDNIQQKILPPAFKGAKGIKVSWLGIKYKKAAILTKHDAGEGYKPYGPNDYKFTEKDKIEEALNNIGMSFTEYLKINEKQAKDTNLAKLKEKKAAARTDILKKQSDAAQKELERLYGEDAGTHDTAKVLEKIKLPSESKDLKSSFSHTTNFHFKKPSKGRLKKNIKYTVGKIFRHYQKKLDKLKNKKGKRLAWVTPDLGSAGLSGPLILFSIDNELEYSEGDVLNNYHDMIMKYLKLNRIDYLRDRDTSTMGDSANIYIGDPGEPTEKDIIELGWDDDFNLVFVLFNGTPLTVGFGALVAQTLQTEASGVPYNRTNAFVARYDFMRRDFRKGKKRMPVHKWCAQFVYPPGELQLAGHQPEPDKDPAPVDKPNETPDTVKDKTKELEKKKLSINQKAKDEFKELKALQDFMNDAIDIVNNIEDAYSKVISRYGVHALIVEAMRCQGEIITDPEKFIIEWILEDVLGFREGYVDDMEETIEKIEKVLSLLPIDCATGLMRDLIKLKAVEKPDPAEIKKRLEEEEKAKEKEKKELDAIIQKALAKGDPDEDLPDFGMPYWRDVDLKTSNYEAFDKDDPANVGIKQQYEVLNVRAEPKSKGKIIAEIKEGTLLQHFPTIKKDGGGSKKGYKGNWIYVKILGGPNSIPSPDGSGFIYPGRKPVPEGSPPGTTGELEDPIEAGFAEKEVKGWVHKKYTSKFLNPYNETKVVLKKGSKDFTDGLKDDVSVWIKYLISDKSASSYLPGAGAMKIKDVAFKGTKAPKDPFEQKIQQSEFTGKIETATYKLLGVKEVTNIEFQKALAWVKAKGEGAMLLSELGDKWRFPTPYVELGGVAIAPPGFWTKSDKQRRRPKKHRRCDDLYTQLLKDPNSVAKKAAYYGCMQRNGLIVYGEGKSFYAAKIDSGEKQATVSAHILAASKGKCSELQEALRKVLQKRKKTSDGTTTGQPVWPGASAEEDEVILYNKWTSCIGKSAVEEQENFVAREHDMGKYPLTLDELVEFYKEYSELPFNATIKLGSDASFTQVIQSIFRNCGDDLRRLMTHIVNEYQEQGVDDPDVQANLGIITGIIAGAGALAGPTMATIDAFKTPKWPELEIVQPDGKVYETIKRILFKMIDELVLFFIKQLMEDIKEGCRKQGEEPDDSLGQAGPGIDAATAAKLNDLIGQYGFDNIVPPISSRAGRYVDDPQISTETYDENSLSPGPIVNLADLIDKLRLSPPEGIGVSKLCSLLRGKMTTGLHAETQAFIYSNYPAIALELSDKMSMKKFFVDIGGVLNLDFCFPAEADDPEDDPCVDPIPAGTIFPSPTLPFQLGPKTIAKKVEKDRLISLSKWVDDPERVLEEALVDPCSQMPSIADLSPSYGAATDSALNAALDPLAVIFNEEIGLFVPLMTIQKASLPDNELVNSLVGGEADAQKMMANAVNPGNVEQTEMSTFAAQMQKDLNPASQRVVVKSAKDLSPSTKQLFICSANLEQIIIRTHSKGKGPNGELLTFQEATAAALERFKPYQSNFGKQGGLGKGHGILWEIAREKTFDETMSEMSKRISKHDERPVAPYLRKMLRNPTNFYRAGEHGNQHIFKLPPDLFENPQGNTGYEPGWMRYKTLEDSSIADTYLLHMSKFDARDDTFKTFRGRKELPVAVASSIQGKGIDYPAELDNFDTPQSTVCAEYAMKLIRSSFGNTGINLEEDSPTSLVMRKNLQPVIAQSIMEGIMESILTSPLFKHSELKKLDFSSMVSDLFNNCDDSQRGTTRPSDALLNLESLKAQIKDNYLNNLEWCDPNVTRNPPDSDQTITGNIMAALVPLYLRVSTVESMLNNIFLFSQHSLETCFGDDMFKDFIFEKVKYDLRRSYLYRSFREKAKKLVQDEEAEDQLDIPAPKRGEKSKKRRKAVTGDESLKYLFEEQFEDLSGILERILGTSIKDQKTFVFNNLIKGFRQTQGARMRLVDVQGADELLDYENGTWASGKPLDSDNTLKRFESLPGATRTKAAKNKNLALDLERGGFILERYVFVKDKVYQDDTGTAPAGTAILDDTLSMLNLPSRPDWTRGYVNLNDWEQWIMSLREAMHAKLGTPEFDTIKGVLELPYSEYFESLDYGLRLTYVLANINPSDEAITRGFRGGKFGAHALKKIKKLGPEQAAATFIDNQDGFVTELTEAVDGLINFTPDLMPQAPEALGGLRTYKTLFSKLNTTVGNAEELGLALAAALFGGNAGSGDYNAYRMIPLFEKNFSVLNKVTKREFEPTDVPSSIFDWGQATFYNKKYSPSGEKHRGHTHHTFVSILPHLKRSFENSPEFKTLFDFVFPIKRYLSMASMYNIVSVRRLQRNRDLFQGTKIAIKDLYFMSAQGANFDPVIPNEGERLVEDTGVAEAAGVYEPSDIDAYVNLMFKLFIECPLEILKGVVEATDPNIQISKKIFDGINMAMKLIHEATKDPNAEPCDEGSVAPELPGYVHPIISLLLFPSNVYGVGFPLPPLGPGFGPPLTPLGAAYHGFGLVNSLWEELKDKEPCDIPAKEKLEECEDNTPEDVKALLKKEFKNLSAQETKKQKPDIETDPNA